MNIAPIILTVITILNPLSAPTAPPEPVGQQTVTNVFQQQGPPYPKHGEQVWDNLAQFDSSPRLKAGDFRLELPRGVIPLGPYTRQHRRG